MNTNEALDIAIRQVQNAIGDDSYRAESAFKHCTQKELDEQYGQSGKTRREILQSYRDYDAKMNDVIKTLKGLKTK